MKDINKFFKKAYLKYPFLMNLLILFLWASVVIILRMFLKDPSNPYLLTVVVTFAGIMNIANGMRINQRTNRKNQGMSMIMLGCIIIFIGIMAIRMSLHE